MYERGQCSAGPRVASPSDEAETCEWKRVFAGSDGGVGWGAGELEGCEQAGDHRVVAVATPALPCSFGSGW